jgi:NADH dehydrogenase
VTDRILVLGGGFAGFWAALAAKRVAGAAAEVTLVSRRPVLEMRPRLYEANPETLGIDLRAPLAAAGIGLIEGEATGLDLASRRLALAAGEIGYTRLVVATGSRLRRPPVPGAETAFTIDTQAEAIAFDRRLAEIARDVAAPTVAVIGAGFTGIELALELRDRIAAHGGDGERLDIVLIDRAAEIGAGLGPGPRPAIAAALAEARVRCRPGVEIVAIGRDRVVLAGGDTLRVDAVAATSGMAAADFVRHLPGPRDRLGRILVDRQLRAPAAAGVFVTGDSAAADTGDGHLALQSCQHALQLGRFAGENAARDLLGRPLLDYAQPRYVTCLDLGRAGAVLTQGWDRAVAKTGAEAKALKRRINTQVIYPPAGADGARLLALSSTDVTQQGRP